MEYMSPVFSNLAQSFLRKSGMRMKEIIVNTWNEKNHKMFRVIVRSMRWKNRKTRIRYFADITTDCKITNKETYIDDCVKALEPAIKEAVRVAWYNRKTGL